ncbi:hypothetical protein OW763_10040 [Clostridium aestuarii]|uniref:Uncharacterized protein n=1 Tax=Clostridium aestuarii TaxID=338193 RepID=A0ABT4D0B8_9CLOT|nr:hypothetical protein [Clostridium aestuarii]MCY6484680.1 hypothetical protein [Clostridium aestuarii]
MNKKEIVNFLQNNGLSQVEEISYKEDILVLKFFYEFDKDEIDAAKSYADDESDDVKRGEIWNDGFFIPYLSDISEDNVGEIIEEITEEFDLIAQYVLYNGDYEQEYNEFIGIFSKKDFEIEDILEKLNI